MNRRLTLSATVPPDVFAANLRAAVAALPATGRQRPAHVTGINAHIELPGFHLECERTYREYYGPVCDGTITPSEQGSLVEGRIHRSRGVLLVPVVTFGLLVVGWLLLGRPAIGTLVVSIIGALGVAGWIALMSLFASAKHEAEADALVGLLHRAADRQAKNAVA